MITAHPPLLRELIERCETLRRHLAADNSPETTRRLEDAAYTLCVITATRQLDTALFVARRQIAEATRQGSPSATEMPPWPPHEVDPGAGHARHEPRTANRTFQPRE
ncbi:DUF5133 domain-containing protein [Streptomyces galilaeus]|uniref:DUF5133 domain-containing protein n=1 Tax=Streptomyces galilaeus TaxID=33899 RepID=UPI0038F751DC